MVKVVFLNLLRSKYGFNEIMMNSSTLQDLIVQLLMTYPQINALDFKTAVVFVNQERIDQLQWSGKTLNDGDEVILTHFVGGG